MQNKNKLISILLLPIFLLFKVACENEQQNKLPSDKSEIGFCSLLDFPEKYKSKPIQIKGIVVGFHTFIFYNKECLEQNKVIALEMNYESRKKLIESIKANNINYKTNFLNHNLYGKITAQGELKENNEQEEAEVFRPKYKFFVNEIKIVNILSEEIFPY